MIIAYTLVKIKPHKDRKTLETVRGLPSVEEVILVYGEYDLIVKIKVESLDKLDPFIFDTLRAIEGVQTTTTLIAARLTG